jgi:hypothetical protein
MKRLISLTVMTLVLGVVSFQSAFAQGRATPEQMRERLTTQIDETITALDLSGDKAESVKAILVAQGEKRFELIGTRGRGQRGAGQGAARQGQGAARQGQGGRGAMREGMAALDLETTTLLTEILSETELEKYLELVASRRPAGRRGAGTLN